MKGYFKKVSIGLTVTRLGKNLQSDHLKSSPHAITNHNIDFLGSSSIVTKLRLKITTIIGHTFLTNLRTESKI